MSCSKRIKTIIRKSDMYGAPIGLRYKSENTYQTIVGGSFTLFSRVAILCYFVYGLRDVYYKKNSIVKKTLFRDMFVDQSRLHLTTDIFDVGVKISFFGDAPDAEENLFRYMEFQFFDSGVNYDENGDMKPVYKTRDFNKCKTERFGGDLSVIQQMSLTDYYCANLMDTEIYGSQTGESNQFGVFINQCSNVTLAEKGVNYTCDTQQRIDEVFDLAIAQVVVMSSYFDAYEFDTNPIKKQYETYIYSLAHNIGQGQDIYVQENELITFDSQVGTFLGGQTKSYLSTFLGKPYTSSVKPGFLPQLGVYFMISPSIDSTTRQVRSIMDCLTETGGFSNVIGLLAKLTILKLQQQLFYQSLMRKMFKVQQSHTKKSKQVLELQDKKQVELENIIQKVSNYRNGANIIRKYLTNSIPQRIGPEINILKQRLRKLCCFWRYRCQKQEINTQQIIFNNALKMFDQQFDIVKMMNSVRSSDLLQKLMLSESQRRLIPYFKDNIISSMQVQGEKVTTQRQAKRKLTFKGEDDIKNTIKKMLRNVKESDVSYKILKELIISDDQDMDMNVLVLLKEISKSKQRTKASTKTVKVQDNQVIPYGQNLETPQRNKKKIVQQAEQKSEGNELDLISFDEAANSSVRQLIVQPISDKKESIDLQHFKLKSKGRKQKKISIIDEQVDLSKMKKRNQSKLRQPFDKASLDFQ